jgi:hypothetical protein
MPDCLQRLYCLPEIRTSQNAGANASTPMWTATVRLSQNDWPGRKIAPSVFERLSETRGQPGLEGEALLTILDAVGAGGPGDLAPNATVALVRALKAEGAAEAARAFAADALLLYHYHLPETFRLLPPAPAAQP